jgi:hypothetical protein
VPSKSKMTNSYREMANSPTRLCPH